MRARALLALPLIALPLTILPGCRMNERMTGTIGGAVGGGLVGVAVGASAGGVLLAMAGGAVVGYVIGDYLSDQHERCGCEPPPCGACAVPAPCECYPSAHQQVLPLPSAPAASATSAAARAAYERGRSAATAEAATAAYEESIRLDPTRPEPWNALALHALVAGDRATARTRFTTALALDPSYGPARHNLERLDRGL